MLRWFGERKEIKTQSPLYSFTSTDAANGSGIIQELGDRRPYDRHAPYNFLQVSNQTNKTFKLYVNGYFKDYVLSNTIKSYDSSTFPEIWSFMLINESGASATGTCFASLQKTDSQLDVLKRIAGNGQ